MDDEDIYWVNMNLDNWDPLDKLEDPLDAALYDAAIVEWGRLIQDEDLGVF